MATNSADLDLQPAPVFVRRVQAAVRLRRTPLLVLQLPELERIAWRRGFAAAKMLERQALAAFAEVATRALRPGDCVAHDVQSGSFLVALIARGRDDDGALPRDCRTTLARLAGALGMRAQTAVKTGWTVVCDLAGERALASAIAQALEYGERERERWDFFAAVGHELRTPLCSIRGYLETLIDGELEPSQRKRFLEIARSEAVRMERMLCGMLDLSLLDQCPPGLAPGAAQLDECCANAADAVRPIALERGADVRLQAIPAVLAAIEPDRLVQALTNVVLNAVRHGRERGLVVLAATCTSRYAEICVDDNGPGIAPGDERRVFDFATRGRDVNAPGCGLGLALVRSILDRAGGEVRAERSRLGGARIVMRIPLAKAE